MKRAAIILSCLGLVVGMLCFGALWIMAGAPMPAIPPARTAAPEGFDAALYPELAAVASTDRAEVLNLGAYGRPFEHYFLSDLSVVCFTLFTDEGQSRTLFVNSRGALIGDITEWAPVYSVGPFIVTPDAYYEVAANGVSGRQPLQAVSPASTAALLRMIEESTWYVTFLPMDLPADDADRAAGRSIHVMRHGGVWKRAASAEVKHREWKFRQFDDLDAVYRISRAAPSGDAANFFGGRYRVELTHFDQREFLPQRNAPMGSPTGMGRAAQWIGVGYYTVFIDNVPALRFRVEHDREFLSETRPVYLTAEGGAAVDFIALTHTDRRGWREVIVVSGR